MAVLRDAADRCALSRGGPQRTALGAVNQPVSSTLSAPDSSTEATSASCGAANAKAARWQIRSKAPTDTPSPNAVFKLKQELDGDILVNGSVQLVRTLIDQGLASTA